MKSYSQARSEAMLYCHGWGVSNLHCADRKEGLALLCVTKPTGVPCPPLQIYGQPLHVREYSFLENARTPDDVKVTSF